MCACLFFFDHDNPLEVVLYLFITSLSMAFSNVVIDAILVVQARKDPELGSQDILTLAWLFNGFGGVVGCIAAAYMMERYHPRYAFFGFGIWSLIVAIACFFLSSDAEKIVIDGEVVKFSEWSSEVESKQTPSEAEKKRNDFEAARPAPGEEGFSHNFKKNMKAIWLCL
jgi:MFS family permease